MTKNKARSPDVDGKRGADDVARLCTRIAEQAAKDQWWNAMAYAAELVVVCQNGCRAEIARVVAKRTKSTEKKKAKKDRAAKGKPAKAKDGSKRKKTSKGKKD